MSMAKSTAFWAVSDPSVPTPIVLIIAAPPLALGVARERPLLGDVGVLPVPDRDRSPERRADDHGKDDPPRPALGDVDDGVAEPGRDCQEDGPLDCDPAGHARPFVRWRRPSLNRAGARRQARRYGMMTARPSHSQTRPSSFQAPVAGSAWPSPCAPRRTAPMSR